MSDIASRIDIDSIVDLTVSQWDDSPRLRALIRNRLKVIKDALIDPLIWLERQHNLNTAEGIGLDWIGERVDLERPVAARTNVDDETYRLLLRLRGRALWCDGTTPMIDALIQRVFPMGYCQDHADGTVTIHNVVNDPRPNLGQLALTVIERAIPAGIRVTFALRNVPPEQPSLTATVRSSTQVDLEWTEPSNDGPAINGYDVEYKLATANTWTDAGHTDLTRMASITGLSRASAYQFRVRAVNAAGNGTWATASATTQAELPAAPVLTATVRSSSRIDLSWTQPNNGGATITGYDVQYKLAAANSWTDVSHTGTGRTASITGLTRARAYQFRVRAMNAAGNGTWATASATTQAELPAAPVLTATVRSSSRIDLSWTQPNNGGATITGYDVQYKLAAANSWTDVSHTGTGRTASITGLTRARAYQFRVRAMNAAGNGTWATASATTQAELPAAPVLTATVVSSSRIDLLWTQPDSGGAAITGYDVEYKLATAQSWTDASHSGTVRTDSITGLTRVTAYQFRVRAVNSVGNGGWSAIVSASTISGVIGTPTLTATVASSTQVNLSWTEPDGGGNAITGYDVEYKLATAQSWTDASHSGTVRTDSITGLMRASAYQFRVRGRTSAGVGPWATASATTQAELPAAPVLTATVVSSSRIDLLWTQPDSGGAAITGYDVEYKLATAQSWTDASHSGTVRTDSITGLMRASAYQFRVRGRTSAGVGPWATASATTQAELPAAPVLTATVRSSTRIDLSWTEPTDTGGAAITDYDVEWRVDPS
ncbi:MAG: fibronectin type III domain-containing protein [Chloroflexi bacterium]|nr:fibronectin type III domain-containing protein [Chloroflexota bacterium]